MLIRTLAKLRGDYPRLADDVIAGKRFFWLGSGISGQVPGLVQLMKKALLFLRDMSIEGPEARDHRDALLKILDDFLPGERALYENDPVAWVPADLARLRNHYSEVFNAWVGDHPSDYLLIEGTDLPRTYGDSSILPGPEHKLLAILVAEDVVTAIASGNWDGLVEAAVNEMTGSVDRLDVYVLPEDPRNSVGHSYIAKFHGCAVLALRDPETYRKAIIATTAQVSRFSAHPGFEHMRDLLTRDTQQLRSLVLGLSVQDQDLLDIFTGAAANLPWPWEESHPAYVFAELALSTAQRNVLQNSYEEFDAHRTTIDRRSAFGEFALPLLAALVADVISRKLSAALKRQTLLAPNIAAELKTGINRLEALAATSIRDDYSSLITFLTELWSEFIRSYAGSRHFPSNARYASIAPGSLNDVETKPEITIAGYDRFAVFIGIIGVGDLRRRWRARLVTRDGIPFMKLRGYQTKQVALFAITRSPEETDRIIGTDQWAVGFEHITIMQAAEQPTPRRRSSASSLGSARRKRYWDDVDLELILQDAYTANEIIDRFATVAGV